MTPTGCEQGAGNTEKPAFSGKRAAKCAALSADRDLARLLDAWPTLPATLRAAILAMIDAAVPNKRPQQEGEGQRRQLGAKHTSVKTRRKRQLPPGQALHFACGRCAGGQ